MQNNTSSPVLVTGASGYVASHIIKLLLERGYKVRGTVRSLAKKQNYEFLYTLLPEKNHNLQLVEADLTNDASWLPAVDGCEYVFHVATSMPETFEEDDDQIVGPAVAGTVSVLNAALEKGVKKIVITSSIATLTFTDDSKIITEEDWEAEEKTNAYGRSKIKAEKAAWEFYEKNKDKIQLTTVLPSLVFGPTLSNDARASLKIYYDIMAGRYPGVMDIGIPIVDVRDVAESHLRAMFKDEANGKRYTSIGWNIKWEEMIHILKKEFDKFGVNISDKPASAEDIKRSEYPLVRYWYPMIGRIMRVSNERSVKELGVRYHALEKTLVDTGYSFINQGIISPKTKNV